jgi:UDP-glucose 4-epimerase
VSIFGVDYPTLDGTCVRDYIHVEDLAEAHLLALESTDLSDGRTGASPETGIALALNLGTAAGFSVREVLDAAERITGEPIAVKIAPRRVGDPPVLVAAADRAAALLGWRATRPTLEEMIGSAWAWRLAHPDGYDA